MKFVVTALAVLGIAYLIMIYAGTLWQKVAFTAGPVGPVSYAACILSVLGVAMLYSLGRK